MADLRIDDHGSIAILTPVSPIGKEWVDAHFASDVMTWGANGIVVEPRYLLAIVEGATGDGLEVSA